MNLFQTGYWCIWSVIDGGQILIWFHSSYSFVRSQLLSVACHHLYGKLIAAEVMCSHAYPTPGNEEGYVNSLGIKITS